MTSAQAAREAANVTLVEAGKAARKSGRYIRRLERSGSFPLHIAERLARRYGCRVESFLPQGGRAAEAREGPGDATPPGPPAGIP